MAIRPHFLCRVTRDKVGRVVYCHKVSFVQSREDTAEMLHIVVIFWMQRDVCCEKECEPKTGGKNK